MLQAGENIERLECVYYPGPIPSNLSVLTTLCVVFDKIYFPKVHLPLGGYDKIGLQHEIARLTALNDKSYETGQLINVLKFLEWRNTLDGILEYPSPDSIFEKTDSDHIQKMVRMIYDVNFPPRENFEPMFSSGSSKSLPGGEESVDFAGEFFYQAEALSYSAERNIPAIDDGSGLPLPFKAKFKDRVQPLSAIMAIESLKAVMPKLPILTPQEIVEFRMENKVELKNFRAAMLRLSGALNGQLSEDSSNEEVQRKSKFIVETQVVPSLHDLNRDLQNPNRAWYKRFIDGASIASSVAVGIFSGGIVGTTAADGLKKILASELEAKGDKAASVKRNGLYYLVRAQATLK
jgi:hypothetical protein